MYGHEQEKKNAGMSMGQDFAAGQPAEAVGQSVEAAGHKAGMSTGQEVGIGLGVVGVLAAGAAAYGVRHYTLYPIPFTLYPI